MTALVSKIRPAFSFTDKKLQAAFKKLLKRFDHELEKLNSPQDLHVNHAPPEPVEDMDVEGEDEARKKIQHQEKRDAKKREELMQFQSLCWEHRNRYAASDHSCSCSLYLTNSLTIAPVQFVALEYLLRLVNALVENVFLVDKNPCTELLLYTCVCLETILTCNLHSNSGMNPTANVKKFFFLTIRS